MPGQKRDKFERFIPDIFLHLGHLRHRLVKAVMDPERSAQVMRTIATLRSNDVEYVRFSATNGIHLFEMDAFKDLNKIESLTQQYIEQPEIQQEIEDVAEEVARDFVSQRAQ